MSDYVDLIHIAPRRTVKRRPARTLIFWNRYRPAWMLAGVYAVKLSVVDRYIVHVAGSGYKLHPLKDLPGLGVILEKTRRITRISRNVRLLKATHLPQIA